MTGNERPPHDFNLAPFFYSLIHLKKFAFKVKEWKFSLFSRLSGNVGRQRNLDYNNSHIMMEMNGVLSP
jgi:hypothetical protein